MRWCDNCGKLEPGTAQLMVRPNRAFHIRANAVNGHNFCTFDCSRQWHEKALAARKAAQAEGDVLRSADRGSERCSTTRCEP